MLGRELAVSLAWIELHQLFYENVRGVLVSFFWVGFQLIFEDVDNLL